MIITYSVHLFPGSAIVCVLADIVAARL